MRIVREEIFGPVAAIIKFKDEDEAVKIANDNIYALSSAVFTRDISRALTIAHRVQAGTVGVSRYFCSRISVHDKDTYSIFLRSIWQLYPTGRRLLEASSNLVSVVNSARKV